MAGRERKGQAQGEEHRTRQRRCEDDMEGRSGARARRGRYDPGMRRSGEEATTSPRPRGRWQPGGVTGEGAGRREADGGTGSDSGQAAGGPKREGKNDAGRRQQRGEGRSRRSVQRRCPRGDERQRGRRPGRGAGGAPKGAEEGQRSVMGRGGGGRRGRRGGTGWQGGSRTRGREPPAARGERTRQARRVAAMGEDVRNGGVGRLEEGAGEGRGPRRPGGAAAEERCHAEGGAWTKRQEGM